MFNLMQYIYLFEVFLMPPMNFVHHLISFICGVLFDILYLSFCYLLYIILGVHSLHIALVNCRERRQLLSVRTMRSSWLHFSSYYYRSCNLQWIVHWCQDNVFNLSGLSVCVSDKDCCKISKSQIKAMTGDVAMIYFWNFLHKEKQPLGTIGNMNFSLPFYF